MKPFCGTAALVWASAVLLFVTLFESNAFVILKNNEYWRRTAVPQLYDFHDTALAASSSSSQSSNNTTNNNNERDPKKEKLERRKNSYKEQSRKLRRTSFTHENWVEHRSPDRFVGDIQSFAASGITKGILKEVMATVTIATLICVFNACVTGYTDLDGMEKMGPWAESMLPTIGMPLAPFMLSSPSLGFLLVFRTNSAYQRWEEARKNWGNNINNARDLVRMASAWYDREGIPEHLIKKDLQRVALCTWAFCRSMKRQLSPEWEDEEDYVKEIRQKLPPKQAETLLAATHRPNRALQDLSAAIEVLPMNIIRKNEMQKVVSLLEDNLGGSERLLSSPVPLFYSRHTARFLSVWLLFLPLALYEPFMETWNHVGMIPATAAISMALFGIEELATQLEEPFTLLPMQEYVDKIYDWCAEIVSIEPNDNNMFSEQYLAEIAKLVETAEREAKEMSFAPSGDNQNRLWQERQKYKQLAAEAERVASETERAARELAEAQREAAAIRAATERQAQELRRSMERSEMAAAAANGQHATVSSSSSWQAAPAAVSARPTPASWQPRADDPMAAFTNGNVPNAGGAEKKRTFTKSAANDTMAAFTAAYSNNNMGGGGKTTTQPNNPMAAFTNLPYATNSGRSTSTMRSTQSSLPQQLTSSPTTYRSQNAFDTAQQQQTYQAPLVPSTTIFLSAADQQESMIQQQQAMAEAIAKVEKAAQEKAAVEIAAAKKAMFEQAAADRKAAERATAEANEILKLAAAERAEAERLANEAKRAAEQAMAEKQEAERLSAQARQASNQAMKEQVEYERSIARAKQEAQVALAEANVAKERAIVEKVLAEKQARAIKEAKDREEAFKATFAVDKREIKMTPYQENTLFGTNFQPVTRRWNA